MKTVLVACVALVLLFGASGCGGRGGYNPAAEKLVQQQVDTLNQMTAAYERVNNDASADAAIATLEKCVARYNDINKQLDKMKLSLAAMETFNKSATQLLPKLHAAAAQAVKNAPSRAGDFARVLEKIEQQDQKQEQENGGFT